MSERSEHRPLGLDVAATTALAAYSAAAAVGFARVFGNWEFIADLLAIVIVGHGLSILLRRTRLHGAVAATFIAAVLVWLIAWIHYPDTFGVIFPSGETWAVAHDDLSLASDQFRVAVAPVAYVGGFAVMASIGMALAVLLGDTFAFRAQARGEALVPGGVLFVFVAAVGSGRDRVALTMLLVGTGFLAAALLRALFDHPARTTLGRQRTRLAVTLPAAIVAASLVAVAAWAVGPRLPGANAEPLYKTRGRGGGVTEVINPLVDIRGRLVNRSARKLFNVRASSSAYWRFATLPEFDGQTWRPPDGTLEDTDGALSEAAPGSTENRQRITVIGLDGSYVPAAAEPIAASGPLLRWSPDLSTLVKIEEELDLGDFFDVISAMPRMDPAALGSATSNAPPDPIYLALPDGFPTSVGDLAAEVTAGQATPYGVAITLQDWFRANFEYSLEVPQGHGNSAIEAFVRQRIGYCEQFAGTFAAMARSLGVPSRVAVGFTPGLIQPDGSFEVLGRNAHAWPEVWFDQYGWVAFEPTPGRGAPGAEGYTGVAPAQDETVGGGTGDGAGEGDGAAAPAPATPAAPVRPNEPDLPGAGAQPGAETAEPDGDGGGTGVSPLAVAYLALVLFALAWLPFVVRRWRRRHPRGGVEQHIAGLWRRAVSAIEVIGVRCPPSATPSEIAAMAAPRLAVAARPLHSLADVVTATAYSAPGEYRPEIVRRSGSSVLTDAGRWCRQIEEVATDSMNTRERLKRHFTEWR